MTIEQFDKTGFTGGMKCRYKLQEYDIIMVDFEEKLIAINETKTYNDDSDDDLFWKRCENITLL